jgi:hypothetical protein
MAGFCARRATLVILPARACKKSQVGSSSPAPRRLWEVILAAGMRPCLKPITKADISIAGENSPMKALEWAAAARSGRRLTMTCVRPGGRSIYPGSAAIAFPESMVPRKGPPVLNLMGMGFPICTKIAANPCDSGVGSDSFNLARLGDSSLHHWSGTHR